MALAILAPVVCRRLPAKPIEAIIDPVGTTGHRVHHAVGPSRRSRIKVRRAEIVQVDAVGAVGVAMMVVTDAHVGGKCRR